MKEDIALINCNSCGVTMGMTQGHLEQLQRSHKVFWCPNMHGMSYPKPEPPKPKAPTIIEREVEVVVVEEYEPKDFTEMLKMHEHDFSQKTRGQTSCKLCGLYEVAYKTLTD